MSVQHQTEIHVPALMDGDRVVVPQFWLGRDVEYRKDREDNFFSAAEYNAQMQLPTLAELRHAFFDKNPDVSWVSPKYRKSVLSKRSYGEWTSTFLEDGKKAVERPENVVYRNGVWILEGGKVTPVELPPDGWTLEYDKPTGFPSRVSQKRKDAEKVFGNDVSYFYAARNGLRVVWRVFDLFGGVGPFGVLAIYEPANRPLIIGGRSCRRSEQGA